MALCISDKRNFGIIKEVNKRLILIGLTVFVLIVIVFTLILSAGRGNEEATPEETVLPSAKPTAVAIDNEWNEIVFPADGVSVHIPQKWNTYVYESSGSIYSIYVEPQANVDFNLRYNADQYADIIKTYASKYSLVYEEVGVEQAVNYVGLANTAWDGVSDTPTGPDKDSYAVGKLLSIGGRSLIVHCQTYGPRYTDFISDCNRIIESLSIE